jgi:hypothetical protein
VQGIISKCPECVFRVTASEHVSSRNYKFCWKHIAESCAVTTLIVLLWGCIDRGGNPIQITVAGVACSQLSVRALFSLYHIRWFAYAVAGNACKYSYVAVGVEYMVTVKEVKRVFNCKALLYVVTAVR